MTRKVFEFQMESAKRKRANARKKLLTVLAVITIICITPLAVDSAYISRGEVFKIGGEWFLLPLFFAVRAVIKEMRGVYIWQK